MHEETDPWLNEIFNRIPDEAIWGWIEELHGHAATEKVVHRDIYADGIRLFSYVSDTLVCSLGLLAADLPSWIIVKAVKYWLNRGWELPR